MRKNSLILLPLICCILAMTSGCRQKDTGEYNIFEEGYQDIVTIDYSLWGSRSRNEYTLESVEQFERLHPGIHVNVKFGEWEGFEGRMDSAIANGTEADVMQINYGWLEKYSADGDGFYDLYKLRDYISLKEFDKEDLEYGIIDGKLNAIPIAMNTTAFIYNKSLYDEYDLDIPESYADLISAAQVMRADDVYPLAMDRYQIMPFMFTYMEQFSGISAFDDEGNVALSDDNMKRLLKFYSELINDKVLMPSEDFSENDLANGRAAGALGWISSLSSYESSIMSAGDTAVVGNYLCKLNVVRMGTYFKPASMLAISKNTQHPVEAAMLVEYLLSSKDNALIQSTEKGIPVSKIAELYLMEEGLLSGAGYKAKLLMDYNYNKMSIKPAILENQAVEEEFVDILDSYAASEISLDEAIKELKQITD